MEAALGWIYDLLTAPEQTTFRTLSMFAGGFDLPAAEAIGRVEDGDGRGVLGELIDKSLVVAIDTTSGRRFRLLEPVRQYAERALLASGEGEAARTRHAAYYGALAERAAPMLRGPEQVMWLDRLERDRENLRAALAWIAEHGAVDDGLRLAVALTPYWEARGYLSEGRRWLEAVLAASRAGSSSLPLQMRALMAAGILAKWQGDLEYAVRPLTEALAVARDWGDRHGEGAVLGWLPSVHWQRGAIELGLQLGEESLRQGHEVADEAVIAFALLSLGAGLLSADDAAQSVGVLSECLRRYRGLGDARYAAMALTMLGWSTLETGEHKQAGLMLRQCLHELRVAGDRRYVIFALGGLARVFHAQGQPRQAVQLFAASEALRTSLGMRHADRHRAKGQLLLESLRQQLSASEFDETYATGSALSLDQVLADIETVL